MSSKARRVIVVAALVIGLGGAVRAAEAEQVKKSELEARVVALEAALAAAIQRISTTEAALTAANQRIATTEAALTAANTAINGLKTDVAQNKSDLIQAAALLHREVEDVDGRVTQQVGRLDDFNRKTIEQVRALWQQLAAVEISAERAEVRATAAGLPTTPVDTSKLRASVDEQVAKLNGLRCQAGILDATGLWPACPGGLPVLDLKPLAKDQLAKLLDNQLQDLLALKDSPNPESTSVLAVADQFQGGMEAIVSIEEQEQDAYQLLSEVSKIMNDTLMAIIRKIGAY